MDIMNHIEFQAAARLGQVEEYYFSKKLREIRQMNAQGENVLNLGIGSPDLAPHHSVIQTLMVESTKENANGYQGYKGIPELRNAFAQWYHKYFNVSLDADTEVLPLIGSKEGIMHISMAFLNQGDEVLVPNPGYPAYAAVTKLAGATVRNYDLKEENAWLPDFSALESQGLEKVKIMWVNYPHMPTGTSAPKNFFRELVEFGRRNEILICHDNPYAFILNDNPRSLLEVEGAKDVCLELASLSKAHNMAGWRVGVLAGRQDILDIVLRFKSNMDSGMYRPVQLAAVKALSLGQDWYDGLNNIYRKRREKVFELLELLGTEFDKNQTGMFVWAKIPKTFKDGFELSDKVLYGSKVFITPGGIFGSNGDGYIRVSLCSKEEIFEEAIERIKEIKW